MQLQATPGIILFEDDWKLYPHAIADDKTTNKTFLNYAAMLKSMGVKNYKWPLALMNPNLQGVDPHSPDLTAAQMAMIIVECRINPWYYFREVIRIPPQAGDEGVKFRANRGNMSMAWCFFNHVDYALIQPRQTGKSVGAYSITSWLLFFGARNSLLNLYTMNDKLRKEAVLFIKRIRKYLPKYLNWTVRNDSDNLDEITAYHEELNNRYKTSVAQSSEDGANMIARGLTSPFLHGDEIAFCLHVGTTLPAALSSGNAARAEAAMNGKAYGNLFTTTAGKKDDRDGGFAYRIIHDAAPWSEFFFDSVNIQVLTDRVIKAGKGRKAMIHGCFSHRQLGYTDEWLYKAMADTFSYGEKADRDYLNIWTAGTQKSPLPTHILEAIRNSKMEIQHVEIHKDNFLTNWYVPERDIPLYMSTSDFVLGLDSSEAINRDSIAGVVINARDMSVVATFTCTEGNLMNFAGFIADFLIKYKKVTFIPERKSSAFGFIDALCVLLPMAGEDPFRRIYNTIVDEKDVREKDYKEVISTPLDRRSQSFYTSRKTTFGFNTSKATRDLLYSLVLQTATKRTAHLIKDAMLINELCTLTEKKGRIDHDTGNHDDHVVAWLLGHYMLTQTKNLDFYGINVGKINSIKQHSTSLSEEERAEMEYQNELMEEIRTTAEMLEETEDEFVALKLEARMKGLRSKITITDEEISALDALLLQAKEARLEKAKRRESQNSKIDMQAIYRNLQRRRY